MEQLQRKLRLLQVASTGRIFTIVPLDQVPYLQGEASELVGSELAGSELHLNEGYLKDQHNGLPCSLLLLLGTQVVGHVLVRQGGGHIPSGASLRKMLDSGVPGPAVKQRALVAGMSEEEFDRVATTGVDSPQAPPTTVIEKLVVARRWRGLGLGKALIQAGLALSVSSGAQEVGGVAATSALAGWYKRLGATSARSLQTKWRADLPFRVKTGGEDRVLKFDLPGAEDMVDWQERWLPTFVRWPTDAPLSQTGRLAATSQRGPFFWTLLLGWPCFCSLVQQGRRSRASTTVSPAMVYVVSCLTPATLQLFHPKAWGAWVEGSLGMPTWVHRAAGAGEIVLISSWVAAQRRSFGSRGSALLAGQAHLLTMTLLGGALVSWRMAGYQLGSIAAMMLALASSCAAEPFGAARALGSYWLPAQAGMLVCGGLAAPLIWKLTRAQ